MGSLFNYKNNKRNKKIFIGDRQVSLCPPPISPVAKAICWGALNIHMLNIYAYKLQTCKIFQKLICCQWFINVILFTPALSFPAVVKLFPLGHYSIYFTSYYTQPHTG